MSRAIVGALFAIAAASCGSSSVSSQHAKLASLVFDVPSDWQHTETIRRGVSTAVWTPSPTNDRKESVTVIDSALAPAVAQADASTLTRLLASASEEPGAHVSPVEPFTSARGLHGVRVELDFVPSGLTRRYHRVHAVVVDGTHLVHIIYTAADPDADREALGLVLGTIHHEEA